MDVAIKKVRNGIDRIFDKTLQDLVRGVRNNKGPFAKHNICSLYVILVLSYGLNELKLVKIRLMNWDKEGKKNL